MAEARRLPPDETRILVSPPPVIPVEPVVAPTPVIELFHPLPQIPLERSVAPLNEPIVRDYPFTGSWMPGVDSLVIGPQNYVTLQNVRYRNGYLQSVLGYSRITLNMEVAYPLGRSGIQFYKTINTQPVSVLLVQAYNPAHSRSVVLAHNAPIPTLGNYSAVPIHTDHLQAGLGRFSLGPDQTVAYANGREILIWGGEESRIAAFFVSTGALTPLRDYTEAVRSVAQETLGDIAIINTGGTPTELYIGTTRPASGVKLYIQTGNTATRSLVTYYWNGTGWTANPSHLDETLVGAAPLAQTGRIIWGDTAQVAKPRFAFDRVLYIYRLQYSASPDAGTSVYHATAIVPWQRITDLWDGVDRKILYLELNKGGTKLDYTLEATEAEVSGITKATQTGGSATLTTTTEPTLSVPLGGLPPGDSLIVGFSQPMMGLRFKMGMRIQGNSTTFTVEYWDGNGYVTASGLSDGTASLGHSGVINWNPPSPGQEFPQDYAGQYGYYYRVRWSATLSTEVDLDQVLGIPAPRRMQGVVFPFTYQKRLMLCGDILRNEGHKVEFSATDTPAVWNGEDSSAEGKALYFGSGGILTAAVEIYNRYAGSLISLAVFCKSTETWLLTGNSPDSFSIFQVSRTIGCPAPLTMVTAEVSYQIAEDAQRNIALWLSEHGPVAFDGAVIAPIPGLEPYFDPDDARYINMEAIENARGWYDHQEREYNLLIPSGAGQILNNVWLVYDLRRQKWYEKVPSTYPQNAFIVQDLGGRSYQYANVDSGHLLRLEHTFSWAGAGIRQVIETGENFPLNTSMTETLMRYLRLTLAIASPQGSIPVVMSTTYAETDSVGIGLPPLHVAPGTKRVFQPLQATNQHAVSHRTRHELTTVDHSMNWVSHAYVFYPVRQMGR
jgi:hypothetical protein